LGFIMAQSVEALPALIEQTGRTAPRRRKG
jgi:hypothetical protein